MGMIGILLVSAAVSHGLTAVGITMGVGGAALTALGFRFGFCPACTVACLLSGRRTQ